MNKTSQGSSPVAPHKAHVNKGRCNHLGEPTGETRDCEICGGAKGIPLMACAVHGVCTNQRKLSYREKDGSWVQAPFCMTCPDFVPEKDT